MGAFLTHRRTEEEIFHTHDSMNASSTKNEHKSTPRTVNDGFFQKVEPAVDDEDIPLTKISSAVTTSKSDVKNTPIVPKCEGRKPSGIPRSTAVMESEVIVLDSSDSDTELNTSMARVRPSSEKNDYFVCDQCQIQIPRASKREH